MKNSVSILLCAAFSHLAVADPASSVEALAKPTLKLNQDLVQGWHADGKVDLKDADSVFAHVFSQLPDSVTVYPGENYFYWQLNIQGRDIWGNIRLPSGRRERGVLSFGYSEFDPYPSRGGNRRLSNSKYFTKADGLVVECPDRFTSTVTYDDKTVTFNFNQISQNAPTKFEVDSNETFIQRTFDESGMQFFLMFNTKENYFFWVLDEEVSQPEQFTKLEDDLFVGNRTGFVFWAQPDKQNRKVLATIRKISVLRNDYYDGPFDQLSDNYADESKMKEWMERAIPSIKGRIDKYGYYTDTERPSRVALSNYGNYYTFAEAIKFVKAAKTSFDPLFYISRGGIPPRGRAWDGTVQTVEKPTVGRKSKAQPKVGQK